MLLLFKTFSKHFSPFVKWSELFRFIALILLLNPLLGFRQTYDANYQPLSFLDANQSHTSGTGTDVGDKTVYTNIITIGSQTIDCIVTTIAKTNATFTLPFSPASGTEAFDYSSASGGGMSANKDSFFSPTFSFSAAGSCEFSYQFILGGSYNNTTHKGANVVLENIYVNTYDIDGNGGSGTNQFNEFPTQYLKTVQYGSNLDTSYDQASPTKIRFESFSSSNTTNVTADDNRIKLLYDSLTSINIVVGAAGGSGAAYFFLDFSDGVGWNTSPGINSPLPVDLLFLNAKHSTGKMSVNWETASEENNSHFQIMQSHDGLDWNEIGQVNGNGTKNTISAYQFHYYGNSEVANYFKLVQHDYNGDTEESDVFVLRPLIEKPIIRVFPNPVSDRITVSNPNGKTAEELKIDLLTLQGQVIKQSSVNGLNTLTMDILNIPQGPYMVRVMLDDNVSIHRIIKK
jgi:hypothetical protein